MGEPRSDDGRGGLRVAGPLLVAEGALLASVVIWNLVMWLPAMLHLALAVAVDALGLVLIAALLVAGAVALRGLNLARRPRRSVAAAALRLQIPVSTLLLFMAILDSASWIAGAGAALALPAATALWLSGAGARHGRWPQ